MTFQIRTLVTTLIAALILLSTTAHAQSFPKLKDLKIPKPSEFKDDSSDLTKLLGAGAGCAVGGALGVAVFKKFDHKLLEEGYSEDEADKVGLVVEGVGCVIGGKVAVAVIEGMDERSRQKQEEAWAQAVANGGTEPVYWQGPRDSGYSGTVSYEEAEPMADGTQCITRKNYVSDGSGGEGTAYIRYCKNDQDEWEEIDVA